MQAHCTPILSEKLEHITVTRIGFFIANWLNTNSQSSIYNLSVHIRIYMPKWNPLTNFNLVLGRAGLAKVCDSSKLFLWIGVQIPVLCKLSNFKAVDQRIGMQEWVKSWLTNFHFKCWYYYICCLPKVIYSHKFQNLYVIYDYTRICQL